MSIFHDSMKKLIDAKQDEAIIDFGNYIDEALDMVNRGTIDPTNTVHLVVLWKALNLATGLYLRKVGEAAEEGSSELITIH